MCSITFVYCCFPVDKPVPRAYQALGAGWGPDPMGAAGGGVEGGRCGSEDLQPPPLPSCTRGQPRDPVQAWGGLPT